MATLTSPSPQLRFEAPGPGSWTRDRVHMPRPWTPYQQELFPPALAEGFRDAARRYGWLVDYLDFRYVNGFGYSCAKPVDADEVPERFVAAEQAFAQRVWREDAERWEREIKPAAVRAHRAIQAIDPTQLSRDELITHLERCREHQRRMIVQHHTFNGAAFGPIGDFIAHVTDWTEIAPAQIIALARGAAPESAGESAELRALVAVIVHEANVRAVLYSEDDPGAILDRLRTASPVAAEYLDHVGYRLLDSLDVGDPYALEVPDVLVRRLRRAVEDPRARHRGPSDHELSRVRDRVPVEHQVEFDQLLDEARLTSRIRDERGLFSEVWAGGLMRRAILAAGAVRARDGRIDAAEHLLETNWTEMRSVVAGAGGPAADELAQRAHVRRTSRTLQSPPTLGDPPMPPPPLDGLPPAVARAMRALGTSIEALFAEAEIDSEPTIVRGVGASPGSYTGTARVINSPDEFTRLHPGDVLVTVSTTESFNTVLPLLGALVTDSGGLLSHAAIVSREYGIPGVVGTRDATSLLTDGVLVRVSGDNGEVEVLG